MSSFNGKDFIEGDWNPGDITEESTYAYNRWMQEQKRAQLAEQQADKRFDGLTTDQIAAEWKQAIQQEEAKKRPEREYWASRQFLAERPDFVPNVKNGTRIEEYMHAAGLDTTNPDDIHTAAKALESRGLLQLDPSKIHVAPRTRVSEEEMYALPMGELEARAARETGRRR